LIAWKTIGEKEEIKGGEGRKRHTNALLLQVREYFFLSYKKKEKNNSKFIASVPTLKVNKYWKRNRHIVN